MATKSETRIVRAVVEYLTKHYLFYGYHVHGSMLQRSGEPDLDGSIWSHALRRYVHIKIEVKTPTGEPTKLQLTRLREYFRRGYLVGIVTSWADMEQVIMAYEEYQEGTIVVLGEHAPLMSYAQAAKEVGLDDPYGIYNRR